MNDSNQFEITCFFLSFDRGKVFCVFYKPTSETPKGSVLYLHPFAEEMHKSRRMAALQARCFASVGYAVLQVDLFGCGDSHGDFADASWSLWMANSQAAIEWIRENIGGPIFLWGLRLGAALAAEISAQTPDISGLILWQPVLNGDIFLNQFLRIKVASEMLSTKQSNLGTKELRAILESGSSTEVAGYMLSAKMASELSKFRLVNCTIDCPVVWFEISSSSGDQPSQASLNVIDSWSQYRETVHIRSIQCDPFWATQEIHECQELLTETTKAISLIAA